MNGPVVDAPVVDGTEVNGPVGVVGAGTMGAGIAQVAATAGRRGLIADAVPGGAGRAVVIEAVVEDLAVKRALFAELEAVVAAGAILASNTSSLSPTALAAGLTS